jgi:hypothetical protein
LLHDLLQSVETINSHWDTIRIQLRDNSADIQATALNAMFDVAPDSVRKRLVRSFVLNDRLPKEAFAGKKIQEWLVEKINEGLPAGPAYFVLTEESAKEVAETARASMKRFSNTKEGNASWLLSVAFLASYDDEDAVKLLETLLDQRDIDSFLDTGYLIPAAAMSGNGKLIHKIREIITTDKRSRYNGKGHMPPEKSFAQIAANACSLVIIDFPPVGYWSNYDDDLKKRVYDWLEDNPTHTIKADSARLFIRATPFSSITAPMLQAGW